LNVNPRLDPVLRDNSGNTKTFALRMGSPPIDKGGPNSFHNRRAFYKYIRLSGVIFAGGCGDKIMGIIYINFGQRERKNERK
jgi:hypothetical protein